MIWFVYGGSGSGKSEYAESLVLFCSDPGQRYYIATMQAYGEEGMRRVQRHRKLRQGKGFFTLECPLDVQEALGRIPSPGQAAILIECISNLTANLMFDRHLDRKKTADTVLAQVQKLCGKVRHAVIVSNNVFEDGIEYDETTRCYMQCLAEINGRIAALADDVTEVVAGIPLSADGGGTQQFPAEKKAGAAGITECIL